METKNQKLFLGRLADASVEGDTRNANYTTSASSTSRTGYRTEDYQTPDETPLSTSRTVPLTPEEGSSVRSVYTPREIDNQFFAIVFKIERTSDGRRKLTMIPKFSYGETSFKAVDLDECEDTKCAIIYDNDDTSKAIEFLNDFFNGNSGDGFSIGDLGPLTRRSSSSRSNESNEPFFTSPGRNE